MLVSLNFLKKFINFKNTQLKELVKKMDIFGFEIENIENTNINNLVAGEIKKCKKIPGTHLNLCNIFLGKYRLKDMPVFFVYFGNKILVN